MESSSPDEQKGADDGVKNNEEVKPKIENCSGRGLEVDQELDELLDSSLADFGKHVPPLTKQEGVEHKGAGPQGDLGSILMGLEDPPLGEDDPLMREMEEVFGEEFAKQAEQQLTEAMQLLKTDNPDLLKQFEELAKTVGLEEQDHAPSKGCGLEPEDTPTGDQGGTEHTLQSAVEDTLKRIQESSKATPTDREGIEEMSSRLTDMMGNLDLGGGGGEGEEQVLNMMENMMGTLLSKEVLYPSLVDFCKQYPEWLDRHCQELSADDKDRYGNQLRIMKSICEEFEKDESDSKRRETILELMQELQQYGQPPEDLGGMPLSPGGFASPFLSPGQSDNQCVLM